MPIFSVNNRKYLSANEEKTKNMVFEYTPDMSLEDLLVRIEEFKSAVLKGIEEEKKAKEAEKVNLEE